MKAVQGRAIGAPPELVDVERPRPGPGEILLEVAAAGIRHSDAFIMGLPADQHVYGLPLTLGHGGVGYLEELGEGVEGIQLGSLVAVCGPWGCGRCTPCLRGAENYCTEAAATGIMPPGLDSPGSMEKLDLGGKVGAQHTLQADEHSALAIRSLTGGVGADVVFDMVGSAASLEIARESVRVNGSSSASVEGCCRPGSSPPRSGSVYGIRTAELATTWTRLRGSVSAMPPMRTVARTRDLFVDAPSSFPTANRADLGSGA